MVYHSMASVTTLVGESQGHHVLPILQTLFPESLSHQLYHRLCKIMLMILQISEYFQQKICSRQDRLVVRKPCSCSTCVIFTSVEKLALQAEVASLHANYYRGRGSNQRLDAIHIQTLVFRRRNTYKCCSDKLHKHCYIQSHCT